jgi:hypothetical protein
MKAFFMWLVSLWKREPDLVAFLKGKSQDFKDLEAAVVDAIAMANGAPLNLVSLYDDLPLAKRLFAERQDFVDAFKHFVKG